MAIQFELSFEGRQQTRLFFCTLDDRGIRLISLRNGKTLGITLPSADGQEAVIRKAYQAAGGLDPQMTSYIECHGTGTPVGDPIEVEALSRVFSKGRSPNDPLLIGSVKTNLGHSEAASGISGLIKVVLALENNRIPATIGVKKLNPKRKPLMIPP